MSDSLDLAIFRNWITGSLEIINPRISFLMNNSFGIPIVAEFTTIEAINENDGNNVIPLETSFSFGDSIDVNFPSIGDIFGEETTEIEFDDNNSNIANIISISPQEFRFALFFSKKVDVDSTQFNFITHDSQFSVDVDFTMPVSGRIQDVLIRDTIPFSASTENIFQSIQEAKFRLETENRLPLDL